MSFAWGSKRPDFESALLAYMNSEHTDVMQQVNASGNYDDDIAAVFKTGIEQFRATQTW